MSLRGLQSPDDEVDPGVSTTITSFTGEHRWLSNFAPAGVRYNDIWFPSTENAYQAAKSLLVTDQHDFSLITPGQAKRLGKTKKIRGDWDEVKLAVMESLLRQKFTIPLYRLRLAATGDCSIIEGNSWGDTFWGVCDGVGDNHLGQLLMKIRSTL